MQQAFTVEDVIQIWVSQTDNMPDSMKAGLQFRIELLHLLAKGKPVSPEQLAAEIPLPIEEIRSVLNEFATKGGELNDDGHVVGAALTLNPRATSFLRKWQQPLRVLCTKYIFGSGLLGRTAEVESICPVTGESKDIMSICESRKKTNYPGMRLPKSLF